MGTIYATDLPSFLSKWGVNFRGENGWEQRARSSGGFDNVFGVFVHHTADKFAPLRNVLNYECYNAADKPIGNATGSRNVDGPVLTLTAAGASNTAGKGGPLLSHRGVIPKDAANRLTFNIEWQNNGVGEPWSEEVCNLYVKVVCAVLDWANSRTPGAPLDAGDVWAHFEWAPGRKIDPFGPCRWNGYTNQKWNMDLFRQEVAVKLLAGVGVTPVPPSGDVYVVQPNDGWWRVSRALGHPISVLQAVAANQHYAPDWGLHPGDKVYAPGASSEPTPPPPPVHPPRESLPTPRGDWAMHRGATDASTIIPGVANEGRVTWYQIVLGVPPTGIYDDETIKWTEEFQKNTGLTVDGQYGAQTETRLRAYRGK